MTYNYGKQRWEGVKLSLEHTKLLQLQLSYCKSKKQILWIPESGICSFCGKSVFGAEVTETRFIKAERIEASSKSITGCRSCHRSFCN